MGQSPKLHSITLGAMGIKVKHYTSTINVDPEKSTGEIEREARELDSRRGAKYLGRTS